MWYPKVEYGAVSVFTPALPQLEWDPCGPEDEGGMNRVNGVTATFIIGTSWLQRFRLQMHESEWPACRDWLRWARSHPQTPFYFWLNRDDVATRLSCLLRAPQVPDPIDPERARIGGVLTREVTLQSSSGAAFPHFSFYGI